jgi:aldehyde dehydrogenase (NAD+)
VRNDMSIACEEIFGPVLATIPYDGEDDARIANDSPYGLAGYIATSDPERTRRACGSARCASTGLLDVTVPFGGYKTSGNGREYGAEGLAEFLEIKSVTG